MSLLSIGTDTKTVKGEKLGYQTAVLYLAPGNESGREVCPNRSPGCSADCLYTAGRGVFPQVVESRIRKTRDFTANPRAFVDALAKEINAHVASATRRGLIPLVRLNGTSDIPWENLKGESNHVFASKTGTHGRTLMEYFPHVQFYDYTKSVIRMGQFLTGKLPPNYHLTFSRSETNEGNALTVLRMGGNVAVVFDTKKDALLPRTFWGHTVIDGDVSDVRPGDVQGAASITSSGVVVGLRAKGKARRDTTSGFVVKTALWPMLKPGFGTHVQGRA